MTEDRLESLRRHIGMVTFSDWLEVTQAMIDQFAEATGDHQFIHVDPAAAAHTPFGGTIAHGFLILSLLPRMAATARGALLTEEGVKMGVNYGGEKVRFVSPVRSGARVRGRFRTLDIIEKRPGEFQQRMEFVVEIEGQEKPAMVAEWIVQAYF